MKGRALGKGLSHLLREDIVPINENNIALLSIDMIEANNSQPRKIFNDQKIYELANSIVSKGLVQPILVTKQDNGKYKVIAGERRLRACKVAGLSEVPSIIKNLSEKETFEIALIENIQRQELTAIEEAEGFEKLIKEYNYTVEELSNSLGKSRSHISNLLRLNQLPQVIKDMVNDGRLTMGHARCLIGHENAESLAHKIIDNDLNVRQTEELIRRQNSSYIKTPSNTAKEENNTDEDLIILGQLLSEQFGIKVVVENSWNGGKISFHYSNLQELDSLLSKLNFNKELV